ncbi:MAG: PAS domain-containing protein [Rhizobiaceae bacterium]|nr:PAS domain-containing protein [Rhizobiaceae bacterium]
MPLAELITSHDESLAKLLTAIHNDGDHQLITKLDDQIKLFSSSIRDIHLSSPGEINQQIKFFLNRSATVGDDTITSSDRQTVEMLIDRYTNDSGSSKGIGRQAPTIDTHASVQLRDSRFTTDELIEQSNSRVSLYNLDYTYEYTSLGNAKFHKSDPSDFVGRHVVDIVGDSRFHKRAKQYYDRCFGGEHLNYSYFLDVADLGERLMDCQLTPYRDTDGCVRGAFFSIEDITDKMEHATQSALSNVVS